jgi:hypothetical protein
MADNFNLSLNGPSSADEAAAGLESNNPAMTYVDFANQIVKNSQTQQYQQQLIDQAKLAQSQRQAASDKGVNPNLKDYLSVDEAVAELKAAGVDDGTIQSFVQALGNQQEVSRQSVDTVIRKKQLGEKQGQAFIATDEDAKNPDMQDENGKPLTAGQSYAAQIDQTSGDVMYVRSGGEGLIAGQSKAGSKQGDLDRKDLQKLGQDLNKISQPSRGNWVSQNIGRAGRALSEIHKHPDLPAQTLAFINEEIGGIFMGGVPPQSSLEASSVENAKQAINARLNYITGNPQIFQHQDLRNSQAQYLIDLLTTLHNSTVDLANSMIDARVAAYPDLKNDRPEDVQNLVDENRKILNAGISTGAQADMTASAGKGQGIPTAGAAPSTPPANRPSLQDIFGGK